MKSINIRLPNLRNLIVVFSSLLIFSLKAQDSRYPVDTPIEDVIKAHPELNEIYKLAHNSGIIQSLKQNEIPSRVTMFLPNNDAVSQIPEDIKEFLLDKSNRELLDTLILFSTLDYTITDDEIVSGMFTEKDSIVTLLSEGASISPAREICVNQQTHCAQIIDHVELHQGNIFIVDSMLYPSELMAVFQ